MHEYKNTLDFIRGRIKATPAIGLVLGSGLGEFADELTDKTILPYSEIPNFPQTTVSGHKGNLVVGKLEGKDIIAMQGRFHYYEGYRMDEVVLPIRIIGMLGVKQLIVTNAAGGINKGLKPGDIMLIKDHINFMGINPLIGRNFDELGPRFPDMTNVYSCRLREISKKVAAQQNISIREGVYIAFSGPSYETPAEIRMASIIGADCVGMSTVPESIIAAHMGIEVLGISCITNYGAGITGEPLSHKEVIETAEKVKKDFTNLLSGIIKEI